MLVTIPRDDDKLFQGPVIKVDNGYWIPPAQTHWGPWCRFPPALDNTLLCIAWTVSWIWICHLIKSPCKDSCGQRRLPTTPRTNQCHFQIKLLNKNMSWELHTRETFQCTCTFWRWRGKKKKEKAFLGSDWRPTCGSFEGGERMRLTYWLVFRCLSRVIFFAVPSLSDVICFHLVKIETSCSDIQSHSYSQVCFHSMLMKLDFEELCIDCGQASINRKSQGEVLSTVDSLALSLWHFVASVQLPEAPAASFMANFLLAPCSAVGEYWEICIHTAAAQLCKQPSI